MSGETQRRQTLSDERIKNAILPPPQNTKQIIMEQFIKVTQLHRPDIDSTKMEVLRNVFINVRTIANFKEVTFSSDDSKHNVLVYKNVGVVNSEMYVMETPNEIEELIKQTQNKL